MRLPLITVPTDNLLGDFATTDNTQTTASTDYLLGAFGLTDNLQARVQRLDAEPANGEVQRRQAALRAKPEAYDRPLPRSVSWRSLLQALKSPFTFQFVIEAYGF